MKNILVAASMALVLAGCDKGAPSFSDVTNIEIDGKRYTSGEYIKTFCRHEEAPTDENCLQVDKQYKKDQGTFPKYNW